MRTNESITGLLPIRKGSQRVIDKNVRQIGKFKYGLTEIKLIQMLSSKVFDNIIVDTDIENIEEIIHNLPSELDRSVLKISRRNPNYAGSDATTDDLIKYLIEKVDSQHLLWTHVTSPFFGADCYRRFISQYFELDSRHDSLVSVDVLREFLWTNDGPLNYETSKERWPFTQSLEPVYLINSAAFAISTALGRKIGDRMGNTPKFFECSFLEGCDVDWQHQFDFVGMMAENNYRFEK